MARGLGRSLPIQNKLLLRGFAVWLGFGPGHLARLQASVTL